MTHAQVFASPLEIIFLSAFDAAALKFCGQLEKKFFVSCEEASLEE
jgi:hypothetical protein